MKTERSATANIANCPQVDIADGDHPDTSGAPIFFASFIVIEYEFLIERRPRQYSFVFHICTLTPNSLLRLVYKMVCISLLKSLFPKDSERRNSE
jgi:hypothetical protein